MSSRNPHGALNAQIYEEACVWFVEMRAGDADDAGRRLFDSWLRKSPEHLRAYLEVSEIWDDAPLVRSERTGARESLIASARECAEVLPLTIAPSGPETAIVGAAHGHMRGRRFTLRQFAAAVCAVALMGALLAYRLHRPTYTTGVGEQRIVTLADGSRVELNSRTQLRVSYSAHERDVDLIGGQALFLVAKNPRRPFIVRSGDVLVRAVGTQFDVDRRHDATTVTVVEGRVVVRQTEAANVLVPQLAPAAPPPLQTVVLDAGEQVTTSGIGPLHPAPANIDAATSWTRGSFVFQGTRLADVVEEFNRQNERRLVIRDPSLDDMRISGVYSSTDPELLIRFLREQPGVKVDESDSVIVISSRQ
ncbi:MAG TPA: FecR domain-containing protein [Steroidobacteraceae bacterium]|nr:FecR domain-containing protein [Steroidobacteraceae bacterium]